MATLQAEILADNPLAYYKLDEASGTDAVNSAVKAKNSVKDPRGVTASNWTFYAGGTSGATKTAITSDPDEPYCMQLAATTGVGTGTPRNFGLLSDPAPSGYKLLPVTPGQTVYMKGRGKLVAGAGTLNAFIFWRNSAGSYIAGTSSATQAGGDNTWKDFAFSAVAPEGAVYADPAIYFLGALDSTSYTIRATKMFIGLTDPGIFFDGSTAGCSWDGTAHASASTRDINGTYTNGPVLGQPGFTQGGDLAVSFDGLAVGGDYVSVEMGASGIGDVLTYESWVYLPSIPAQIDFMRGTTSGEPIVFTTSDGRLRIAKLNTATTWTAPALSPITAARWNHVAFTKNGSSREVFLNGVALGGGGTNLTLDAFAGVMRLGVLRGATTDVPGSAQHAAIYNTALSAARILAHYEAGRNALATASIEIASSVVATAHQDIPAGDVEITAVSSMNAGVSPNIPIGPVSITATSNMTAAVRNGMTYNVAVEDYRPKRVAVEDYRPMRVEVEAL